MKQCESCKYYYSITVTYIQDIPGHGERELVNFDESKSECRINAITINGFPPTFINNWCGQYKEKENEQ